MKANSERIRKDIETLASYTSTPGAGVTRLPFTPEDALAKKYIGDEMKKAGLTVYEDGVGTVIGRSPGVGVSNPAIMIGSHYDSVRNGGGFDGAAGVVAGLEVARLLHENGLLMNVPIEVVAMNDEEGVRFNTGMLSSRAITGDISEEELDSAVDEDGISLRKAMEDFGIKPDLEGAVRKKESILSYLELHIEQGPILESSSNDIGIVTNIAGISVYKVTVKGNSGHAGTTPMKLRHDALHASAKAILGLYSLLNESEGEIVATVGDLLVSPGAANVIPGRVEFTIDIRFIDRKTLEDYISKLREIFNAVEKDFGVAITAMNTFDADSVGLSPEIAELIEDEAKRLGLSYLCMNSGAGHDAMIMANYVPAGMIFVPSKGGISHRPDEWTDYEKLSKGVELLLNIVISLSDTNRSI